MIRVRVHGTPAPQGSKRHVGGGRMVESSRAVGPWREAVRAETQKALIRAEEVDGIVISNEGKPPVRAVLAFLLPRPKSHYGTGRNAGQVRKGAPAWPGVKPDLDKLVRATLDGLAAGGALADDCQVCEIDAAKIYARPGEAAGAVIEITACITQ